jgi:capsular exopolysaccharide synthesis family protein
MRAASLDASNLLSVLVRQKWWVLLASLVLAVAGVGAQRGLGARYTTHGALIAVAPQLDIPELSLGGSPAASAAAADSAVQTVIDTLRAPGFLASVVSQLDLANAPDLRPRGALQAWLSGVLDAAHDGVTQALRAAGVAQGGPALSDPSRDAREYLAGAVRVEAKDRSNLLSLQFTAGSAALSARVLNTMMEHYIANDVAARQAQISQVNQWLSERARELRGEVAAADAQLTAFVRTHDLAQIQGGGTVAAVQSNGAQADLAAARASLVRLQAALDSARQLGARGGAGAAQEALASPLIQALREREAELVQKMGGLASQHPDRLRAEQELRAVRGQIATETERVVASLARETEIARSNVRALEASVSSTRQDARDTSAADAYYAQLSRDADAKRQLYNAFLVRANETQLATAQLASARIAFAATPPLLPDQISPVLPALLGLLAGGFASSAVIVLRHMLRGRVISTQDLVAATGLAVFGSLPELRLRRSGRAGTRAQSPIDETLRAMWLTMRTIAGAGEAAGEGVGCTTVVVTSSEVGEGKTTVAASLASRIAADGFRVMLIDADLRRPRLMSTLSLRPAGRLETVLSGAVKLEEAVITDPASGLHCLLADGGHANPMRLLASAELARLLASLRRTYDFVVLDSPPVLRVADAVLLSEQADLTLFVVECGRMTGDLVAEAIRRFPAARRERLLALLTRVPGSRLDQRDYYGGYGRRLAQAGQPPALGALPAPHDARPERVA